MDEAKGLGVERLSGAEFKAVHYELPVLGIDRTFAYFCAAVPLIVEKGVPDAAHVDPYLVCPACFEPAFDNGDITESLQHPVVRDSVLAPLVVLRADLEAQPVVGVPSYGGVDRTFVFLDVAPYHRHIAALDAVPEELIRQGQLGLVVLGHYKEA